MRISAHTVFNVNKEICFNRTVNRRSNMKRFLVVLLALGLIVAFSAPAAATDVKFSGSYYVAGWYQDNQSLQENAGASNAFYSQRLRVQTVFQVAEGLSLTTRFDAMERVWGQEGLDGVAGTSEKNIQWERAFMSFNALAGTFNVGYQSVGAFGTVFADGESSGPRLLYSFADGPFTLILLADKGTEADIGTTAADKDYDDYAVIPLYKWDSGETGILILYLNDATSSAASDDAVSGLGYKSKFWWLDPYFKTTIGPVYLEGELVYQFGKKYQYETAGSSDVSYKGLSYYLMANVNLGQFYVGGQIAYVSGDDPSTLDKDEAGASGQDYNPCLLLFMEDALNKFAGDLGTNSTTSDTMSNAMLYQGFAGFKPLAKLDVKASLTYAKADEKGTNVSDDYGTEFDVTATYKIYDNLSYMVGFGYLWTGDYYKGTSAGNKVDDNYMVMNKLTLTF